MSLNNGNNVTTYQRLLEGEVKIVRLPKSNRDIPGDFFQPTLFGISSKSKLAGEAAVFIDWMVNDVESNLLFKAEYGIPADPDVSKALQAIATDTEIKDYRFSDLVLADTKVPPSSARAEGSATIMDTLLKLVYEDISAEISTIDASVNRFFTEAEEILSKNKPNG
jgi:multiple sugar transport system substrate-binding protein